MGACMCCPTSKKSAEEYIGRWFHNPIPIERHVKEPQRPLYYDPNYGKLVDIPL